MKKLILMTILIIAVFMAGCTPSQPATPAIAPTVASPATSAAPTEEAPETATPRFPSADELKSSGKFSGYTITEKETNTFMGREAMFYRLAKATGKFTDDEVRKISVSMSEFVSDLDSTSETHYSIEYEVNGDQAGLEKYRPADADFIILIITIPPAPTATE